MPQVDNKDDNNSSSDDQNSNVRFFIVNYVEEMPCFDGLI